MLSGPGLRLRPCWPLARLIQQLWDLKCQRHPPDPPASHAPASAQAWLVDGDIHVRQGGCENKAHAPGVGEWCDTCQATPRTFVHCETLGKSILEAR